MSMEILLRSWLVAADQDLEFNKRPLKPQNERDRNRRHFFDTTS